MAQPDITYSYARFAIALPADHLLPAYQAQYRLYDRFLPHLASMLAPGDLVVDVGANCGDSLAAMADANPSLAFVCAEPDETFFGYLERNAETVRRALPDVRIDLHRTLVGKAVKASGLAGVGGTRHAVIGGECTIPTRPLDEIVRGRGVRLLKSDVDGFDYDVLVSAEEVIATCAPLLYFECQLDQLFQKSGYLRAFEALLGHGYRFGFFDNFGEFVCATGDAHQIGQLLEYLWRQNTGHATRTFYYYDVLAVAPTDTALIDDAVGLYRLGT